MQSWIESANDAACHFPLQNLPFGVASYGAGRPRCVIAIGDQVADLSILEAQGLVRSGARQAIFKSAQLNKFFAAGNEAWLTVREQLTDLFVDGGSSKLKDDAQLRREVLHSITGITMHMPFKVSEYTDFYACRQHAFNVGAMFRGAENALPPNWLHLPIGYNGRASSVIVSGTPVIRPLGQRKPAGVDLPVFGPSRRLDIELEMGTVVGQASEPGQPLSVSEADAMIFGYVLLNDWSARDIQAWEYQPLGPFQAKAFATSISPWVVTKAALEAFRVSTPEREKPLLPYLCEPGPMSYDIDLEIHMKPSGAVRASRISQTNFNNLYYSPAQQLAHHASSGCKMNIGDLLGTGTISGRQKDQFGSLLELSWGGKEPIKLATGAEWTFLEDGDSMILTGWAQGDGYRIGFGECEGTINPAPVEPNW